MKTSETCVAEVEQPVAEKLEAPIRLTPEQLETVAAGYGLFGPGTILGLIPLHWTPAPTRPKTIIGFIIRGPFEF